MSRPGAAGRGVVASALGILALAYFLPTAQAGLELRDEGFFLALARRAAEGELPHRDFVDIYGPGIYLLNGALLRWFDMQVLAVRLSMPQASSSVASSASPARTRAAICGPNTCRAAP